MALRALQGPTGGGAPVGGTGTTNTIPRWTGPSTLGDSVITQSGSFIGIGTVSPGASLHVRGGGGTINSILDSSTSGDTRTELRNNGTRAGYIYWDASEVRAFADTGRFLSFYAGASERARIDSSGALLVGTQTNPLSPNTKLMVSDANNGKGFEFRPGATGTVLVYDRTGGTFLPTDWQSTTFRLSQTAATFDASTAGAGLKLPATPGNTDSQTLDCYQDGGALNSGGVTWTPTVAVGGSTTGVTYDVQVGRYTRIGNTIIAHGYVKLTSNGTGTGSVTIGGLPTSSNTANVFGSGSIGFYANITTTGQLCLRINPNSTSLTLTQTTPAGAATAITDTQFADTGEILFTVCYPAT